MSVTVTRPGKHSIQATCELSGEKDHLTIEYPAAKPGCLWITMAIDAGYDTEESLGIFLTYDHAMQVARELVLLVESLPDGEED